MRQSNNTSIHAFSRSPPIDEWFHAAAIWDQNENTAHLYLNGQEVGLQRVPSDTYLKESSQPRYDIGLKRDGSDTLKGYLRNLIIIGRALTYEELDNTTGITGKLYNFLYICCSFSFSQASSLD